MDLIGSNRQRKNRLRSRCGRKALGREQRMQVVMYMVFFTTFSWLVITVRNRRRVVAVTLAGVIAVTLVGAPQPAQAQMGILKAIQAALEVINGEIQTALTAINTARSAANNLQQ